MNPLLRAVTVSAALLGSACGAWAADSPEGNWRTIDDRSGFAKALVRIVKEADGTYSGTITKTIPRPDYTPQEFCHNCPAPYTGQKIVGLKILSGLQVDPNNPNQLINGKVLDPLSGKLYNCKAKLSNEGRRLSIRGYIGVSMLGRTQVWLRD
jgi:uncharacterized protein (DUF2147 family)